MIGDRLNIVLIVIDSLRKDCVGAYGPTVGREWFGTDVQTPALDAFAEESLVLTSAYPEALPTVPYRRAINTGRRVFPFKNYRPTKWDIVYTPGWQPIDEDVDTLSEVMARSGYRTGYISDCMPVFQPSTNFHRGFQTWHHVRGQQNDRWQPLSRAWKLDLDHLFCNEAHRKRTGWLVEQHIANTADRSAEEDYFAPQVYRLASQWLEDHREFTPFFLMIDCWDPHEPWDPPQHYVDLYNPGWDGPNPIHPMYSMQPWCSPDELKQLRANFAGEVTMMGRWLGHFLESLKRSGRADDTAVVIVSDHGHTLGERGVTGKMAAAQHPDLIDLVAMIRVPDGKGAGRRDDSFVYNIDIVATIASLAGVDLAHQGLDLTPLLDGDTIQQREYVTGGMGQWASYRDREWAMLQHFAGPGDRENTKLFDLRVDPGETADVSGDHPDVVQRLYERILDDAGGQLPTYEAPWTYADGSVPTR